MSCEGICCTSTLLLEIGYSKILYTQRRHNTGLTPMAVASRLCLGFLVCSCGGSPQPSPDTWAGAFGETFAFSFWESTFLHFSASWLA